MKLIVGLGNPGAQYTNTKHNVGFWVIDAITKNINVLLNKEKFQGIYYKNKDFIIAKPLTFMNNSGDFVSQIVKYFDISLNDILIIYDDLDFPVGKAVIKSSGSANGQKGMQDIIDKLKTKNIKRIRIGIGRDSEFTVSDYVLSPFKKIDKEKISKVVSKVANSVLTFVYNDIKIVIDEYGKKGQT